MSMHRQTFDKSPDKPEVIKVTTVDRVSYQITKREYTDEGFMRVPGRVARTGIQQYLAVELGLTDRSPGEIVNVYRPPEEVFADTSLSSYDTKDVTDDHPIEMVNADNFKTVTVGVVSGPGTKDGDYVQAILVVKDKGAIKKIEDGKLQLSAGYTAEYIRNPGVTSDGEAYEFIQRDIRINHVALVDRARAGAEARLFDKKQEGIMPFKVTLDKGTDVEVADAATAQLIKNTIDGLRQRADDADAKAVRAQKDADTAEAKAEKLEEDLEEEKKKSSDAAIGEKVKAVLDTRERARKIAGKDFSCDSMDPVSIQRAALAVTRPNVDWAAKSEAYVTAAWDMAEEKADTEEDDKKKKDAEDSLDKLGKDFKDMKPGEAQAVRDKAYDDHVAKRHGTTQEA